MDSDKMEFPAGQEREIQMTYQNGDSEGLLVNPLGPNLYLLESSSFFDEAQFHDVVEAEPQPDGTLHSPRYAFWVENGVLLRFKASN